MKLDYSYEVVIDSLSLISQSPDLQVLMVMVNIPAHIFLQGFVYR